MLMALLKARKTILFNGIQNIHGTDAVVARAKKQEIKLVAQAQKIEEWKSSRFCLTAICKP